MCIAYLAHVLYFEQVSGLETVTGFQTESDATSKELFNVLHLKVES